MIQNDTYLIYTYYRFRHLWLIPIVLSYFMGFYSMAIIGIKTICIISYIDPKVLLPGTISLVKLGQEVPFP
jgi:hypothetical protein